MMTATTNADSTAAPAKILSLTELKNGNVYLVTEAKIYQFLDGKWRPLIFADVEHAAVLAGTDPVAVGAAPAAPPPPKPVKPEPETTASSNPHPVP